jgi:hypothetical protein
VFPVNEWLGHFPEPLSQASGWHFKFQDTILETGYWVLGTGNWVLFGKSNIKYQISRIFSKMKKHL